MGVAMGTARLPRPHGRGGTEALTLEVPPARRSGDLDVRRLSISVWNGEGPKGFPNTSTERPPTWNLCLSDRTGVMLPRDPAAGEQRARSNSPASPNTIVNTL